MPPTGAPIQELPITTTENGIKSIYAFHIDLKQLDLGYELPKEGRPLAPHHLHVYADTLQLRQDGALYEAEPVVDGAAHR